ncbi:hypothetical protein ACFQXB_05280 [Plastorhodobacter daqingensis]|uniref:Uncharacterized protein n=1 Tax=Plastorhodobacter daqingensis TaxID=1387281 RepID=A0ABW2UJL1_9RHOB
MARGDARALVPVRSGPPPAPVTHDTTPPGAEVELVQGQVHLDDRAAVQKYLPDILGRALARIWIDPQFLADFAADPKLTLRRHGVHLPDSISIEYTKTVADRPKIIVYEQHPGSRFRVRVLYLQLVMLAGK